ncbi:MAG: hypothetical protein JWO89_2984, partial [Verrucomicrobiaceae bacterium]|nr:hypothetical protein [Verrucomicrobiaceae bacterium]
VIIRMGHLRNSLGRKWNLGIHKVVLESVPGYSEDSRRTVVWFAAELVLLALPVKAKSRLPRRAGKAVLQKTQSSNSS